MGYKTSSQSKRLRSSTCGLSSYMFPNLEGITFKRALAADLND
jgi:hypothetical protein